MLIDKSEVIQRPRGRLVGTPGKGRMQQSPFGEQGSFTHVFKVARDG